MTNPNWKPQPGKPAMTRDGKTLVTDLEGRGRAGFWSERLVKSWSAGGYAHYGQSFNDLIEPTAAILAAYGIDADGKPVAKVGDASPPKRTPEQIVGRDAYLQLVFEGYQVTPAAQPDPSTRVDIADPPGTFSDGGKSWEPDAPAPPTRVDDRWFRAACAAMTGVISAGGENYPNCAFDATRYADALMAEVAKREGR